MSEKGNFSNIDKKDEIYSGKKVRWNGDNWVVHAIFLQMGGVELKRTDLYGEEIREVVKYKDLEKYNMSQDKTTADPEDLSRGAVFSATAGTRTDIAAGEILTALERERLKAEEEIEAQYELLVGYLDAQFAIFVRYNDNKFPNREQAITVFHEAKEVINNTNFFKNDFLIKYFAEHDDDRWLETGKFFSFKTDDKIATFELIVTKNGKFDLRAQKGTHEGVLAQKIMDADNSGKIEL